jgi:branched-chain amino acid transport system substrate-binding protein
MESSQVAKTILETKPDLVYFGGITENGGAAVLKELRSEGYKGYFMGADGIAEKDFITEAEIYTDDKVFATLVGPPLSELPQRGQEWLSLYREKHGEPPDAFAAPSYEAALVVIQAIQKAKVPQGDKPFLERARPALLKAMKKTTDFQGILGSWSFDQN